MSVDRPKTIYMIHAYMGIGITKQIIIIWMGRQNEKTRRREEYNT